VLPFTRGSAIFWTTSSSYLGPLIWSSSTSREGQIKTRLTGLATILSTIVQCYYYLLYFFYCSNLCLWWCCFQ
jgi:hypothetical protein